MTSFMFIQSISFLIEIINFLIKLFTQICLHNEYLYQTSCIVVVIWIHYFLTFIILYGNQSCLKTVYPRKPYWFIPGTQSPFRMQRPLEIQTYLFKQNEKLKNLIRSSVCCVFWVALSLLPDSKARALSIESRVIPKSQLTKVQVLSSYRKYWIEVKVHQRPSSSKNQEIN